jgi:hypothetical protein
MGDKTVNTEYRYYLANEDSEAVVETLTSRMVGHLIATATGIQHYHSDLARDVFQMARNVRRVVADNDIGYQQGFTWTWGWNDCGTMLLNGYDPSHVRQWRENVYVVELVGTPEPNTGSVHYGWTVESV